MAYGVTPDGFVRPRLPEIRQEIVADFTARLRAAGYTGDVQTRPDSILGLLIDTFAERETALWEQAEGVYYAMYPGSAIGVSLDRAVSFTGVRRLGDEKSRGYVVLYGQQGTTVPAGSQISNQLTQTIWATAADAVISAGGAADVSIVPTVAPGATYTVTLDGTPYSYTSDITPTVAEILAGLVAALSTTEYDVSSNGAGVRIQSDGRQAFGVSLSANLTVDQLGTPVLAETLEPMVEEAAPGTLTGIITRINGWDAVNNLQAAAPGRLAENDAELRARYPSGLARLGAATLPSISPNVRDKVQGVTAIKVYHNNTDEVDASGRPPHSLHVVVDGGLDDEIGAAIFQTVAAGIDTHGAVVVTVKDSEGANHDIRFDRPAPVYVWVKAQLTLLPSTEQEFPTDGYAQVAASILATGQAHQISQDVLQQRFYCGIYQTPGIAVVTLAFAHSTDPGFMPGPGDYSSDNIAIQEYEVAKFDASRIEVT
ncbi:baseplate J/gp47 family protein [Bordetella petrii]|uniref:baseplate J/gp47 family protein n=1 Tax=Bordetella petrii TaxID=94624 RepID=UPI00372E7320